VDHLKVGQSGLCGEKGGVAIGEKKKKLPRKVQKTFWEEQGGPNNRKKNFGKPQRLKIAGRSKKSQLARGGWWKKKKTT